MQKRQGKDLLPDLRGRLVREALGDRKPVDQTVQTPLLKGPLVLVELAAGHPVAATGLGDVSNPLGHL